ncbi:spore germination protein [Paenibacillus harenae]|uniref:spore germination protein n=1 Tax=Paenibacillus harenae TaxID=306543 RepID=UPI000424D885|nr:spore germination protein [Paenibacillus harenae]
MNAFLQEVKDALGRNDDFFVQRQTLLEQQVTIFGFATLVDVTSTLSIFIEQELSARASLMEADAFWHTLGTVEETNVRTAVSAIQQGCVILYLVDRNRMIVVDAAQKELTRSIDLPSNENILQGPSSSFIEDIDTNIGLIRKQRSAASMRVRTFATGREQRKKLTLIYDEVYAEPAMIREMIGQIEDHSDMEINHIQHVSKLMGFPKWQAIPKWNTTELPQEAVSALLKGKVVLFVDRIPFALVLPNLLWDMFALDNDRNYSLPIMVIIRSIRLVGVLLTLLAPGFYVALVAVNPEVLRIEMALSVAQSREGVPYPAIVEMLIMLVILELIIEASARLPKSIGPTLTMVGGIIIGQAVVTARLVSNLLIIILAATTIANSTVVGFQNSLSIRMFKYVIVILAALYGVLGIMAGMVLLSAYMASLRTFGVPYLNLSCKKGEMKHG